MTKIVNFYRKMHFFCQKYLVIQYFLVILRSYSENGTNS